MPASADPSLPPGVELVELLAESARGRVARVRGRGQTGDLILRTGTPGGSAVIAEAALFARVKDPGLVAPLEWGRTPDGRPYLLRPYIAGLSFDQAARGAPPQRVAQWTASLLSTLSQLHDAGFVHRDIKADNVIVSDAGVHLVDLDLLARAGEEGDAAGSTHHIAPEVLLGHPHEPAADLFSTGVMLAIACCGIPQPGFHTRFPASSFWVASGLDPEAIDPELSSLIRTLVRRHPKDRPASAAAARRMLVGGDGPALDRTLPFLAGREGFAQRLADRLGSSTDSGGVTLLSVEDAEEEAPLVEYLELALALAGHRVARADAGLPRGDERALEHLFEGSAGVVLARASELDGLRDPADLVLSVLVPTAARAPRLVLLLPPDAVRELRGVLRTRMLDDVAATMEQVSWPRVSVGALEAHLARITEGAAAEPARRLAGSLHRRTSGRWSDINRLLKAAERDGVLRESGAGCLLLLSEWPAGEPGDAARAGEIERVPVEARSVLLALACLERPADLTLLATAADLTFERCASGLAMLGALDMVVQSERGFELRDRRWGDAARASAAPSALRGTHARCATSLQQLGARPASIARHRLASATRDAELQPVLDVAQAELEAGALGSARALVQGVLTRAPGLRERASVIQARLELAQGRAGDALSVLRAVHGERLADAPTDALLAAAHACEQSGRRDDARSLFRRAVQEAVNRTQRLRALTGLGYGLFLDGDWEAALEAVDGEPRADDPGEPAAALLNLRGVALTRLRRFDEADSVLQQALARARSAEAPLAQARAELNRAHLNRRRGLLTEAVEGLGRALSAFGEAGHVQGRALALNNLGVLERDLGDLRRARELLGESLALRRRVGDAHGAASSLGSLALVELDAGHVGAALSSLDRARELFARGGHDSDLAMLDQAQALALALAGRHLTAASLLDGRRAEMARHDHAALAARAAAVAHLVSGQRDLALAAARLAKGEAESAGDLAEAFRAACLVAALSPADAAAAAALHDAAARIGSDVRLAEAVLRTQPRDEQPSSDRLAAWLELFDRTGRTDLVASTATWLAEALDRAGDAAGRSRLWARAAEAADALTDGLAAPERDPTLRRLARLVGAGPSQEQGPRRLTVGWFLACNRRMAAERDLDGLLGTIMDMALEITGARRGFLVLLEGEAVSVQIARGIEDQGLPADEARFSRTVVREAVSTRAPVLTTDAASDLRFSGTASIGSLRLRSVLCVPLLMPHGAGGALYLDNDRREAAFDATDAERLASLADQAAVAITNVRRQQQIEVLNRRLAERVELQQQELAQARTLLRRQGEVAPVAGLVGESEAMVQVHALVGRLAPTDLPVLITGPSGSGKDLVARALHARSRRAAGPLVVENVSALPSNLLESELFGHVRGAFTGADRDRVGLFAEADGGSFFLDEIGEMPVELQSKLLRVIETGELRPVGSRRTQHVDVRIIAATNRDLPARVREGSFREDLYYRLNVAEIHMPSLSERLEDVPLLVRHFLDELNAKHGTDKEIADAVVVALVRRSWPGQVRELGNEMARLYFLSDARIERPGLVRGSADLDAASESMPSSMQLEDVERAAIVRALSAARGRKDKAARLLGISRAGLYAKLKRLGLAQAS